ncbi:MAG: tape measure protein [Hyphomonas sp.]|nr:tape measure protein [Hyphomonas sp.]
MARRLRIELDLDAKGFAATITDAAGKTERFRKATDSTANSVRRMEKRMRGLMSTARDLTLILSQVRVAIYNLRVVMTGWLEKVVQANIEVERMTFLLAGMSDKITIEDKFQEAGEQVEFMLDKAAQAPFSIGAMTDSLVKMKAGGLDPLDGSLNSLIDSVAAFGGDDQMLKRASIAIQQMGGKGVVSMEELRQQLGEAVPYAMKLMARGLGLSMKEMVDTISKGELEASAALQKMFGEFERTFGGSAARLMDTFSGRIAQARTALTKFGLALGGFEKSGFIEGGFMDTLNEKLETFIQILATPEVQIFATRVGAALVKVVNGIEVVVGAVFKFRDIIIAAGKTFLYYFAARAVLTTLLGMGSAFLGAAFSATRLGAVAGTTGVAISNLSRRMAIASNLSVSMAGRIQILKVGLRGVGTAFSAMLGPIGIFITTAFFAAEAMGFFKNRTKEAEQAVKDFNAGLVSAESLEVMEKSLQSLQSEYDSVKQDIQAIIDLGDEENQAYWLDKDRERAIELRKEIDKLEATIKKARAQFSTDQSNRSGDNALRVLERELSVLTQDYKIAAKEFADEREKIVTDSTLSETQRTEALADLRSRESANVKSFYDQQIQMANDFQSRIGLSMAQLEKNMAGGGTDAQRQQLQNLKAQYASVAGFVTELMENAQRQIAIFDALPNLLSTTDDDDDDTRAIESRLVSLQSKLAGLKADYDALTGATDLSSKSLAQFNAEVEAGKYSEATAEEVEQARELTKAIDEQTAANKRLKADQALQGRLGQQLQRSTEYAREMTAVLTGNMNDAEAESAAYALRLDLIIGKMSNVTDETRKMREEAIQAFSRGRTAQFLDGLRQATREININLLEREEGARAQFQRDVDRMQRSVDMTHLTEEEKRRAVDITAAWIEARTAQLEEDLKGSFERMLDQWRLTTDNMNSAAAGWMDSFVDKLVEGELSFGDFAKAILADIAKIIIRAQIASAIVAAIGAFSPGGGGGGATATSTTSAGPVFHSGGIVGAHHKGSTQISAGMFSGAPRYHNGGIAGLKPNEVPAVLETGERVLTRQEQRALGRNGGSANVEVNIINQSGEQMQEESRNSRFDGEKYIIDIVTAAMARPGKLRTQTKQTAKT